MVPELAKRDDSEEVDGGTTSITNISSITSSISIVLCSRCAVWHG